MSEERKKPVWPWVVALLIGPLILYVAAYPPVVWLNYRGVLSYGAVQCCYSPFQEAMNHGPKQVSERLFWYETLLLPEQVLMKERVMLNRRRALNGADTPMPF